MFILISILVLGCSGGKSPFVPNNPKDTQSIVLALGTLSPAPAQGAEVTIPVLISGAHDLCAFSFRVEFDKAGLKPIAVDWGAFKGETDAVFNPLDKPGLLPLAYTRLDGGGFKGDGTVCLLRFTVLDPSRVNIHIIKKPGYLVAYDPSHTPLNLTVGGEA
jgi:hypothetical protein